MQHLDDDIFDLFQQAADSYPLDAGKGDWEGVASKLNALQPPVSEPEALPNKKKNTAALILMLMLVAGPVIVLKDMEIKNAYATLKSNNNQQAEVIQRQPAEKTLSIPPGSHLNQMHTRANTVFVTPAAYNIRKQARLKDKIDGTFSKITSPDIDNGFFANHGNINRENNIEASAFDKTSGLLPAMKQAYDSSVTGEDKNILLTPKIYIDSSLQVLPPGTVRINRKSKIYIGLAAGVEFSKVSSRPFGKANTVFGITAGVMLSKNIALETGLGISRKTYTSDGAMFKMDKVKSSMQGMTINQLESKSSLIEIPVSVKFYLHQKKGSAFFLSPGLVSYIMVKETNNYNVAHNGVNENVTGFYNTNNYSIPAAATFSAGFQKPVFTKLNASLAPYINIPLQGIGVGSLPVTSAGIRLAITGALK